MQSEVLEKCDFIRDFLKTLNEKKALPLHTLLTHMLYFIL